MPIDKFGRHILRDRSTPYLLPTLASSPQSSPFYICEPSLHHSKCIIKIKGSENKLSGMYTLENQKQEYIFPISGKIEYVDIFPTDCEMFHNFGSAITPKGLIGLTINKGDKLLFNTVPGQPSLHMEMVLQCPITKNV